MSVTDNLRRLLDERGIEHSDHYLHTSWLDAYGVLHLASEQMDKTLILDCLTPEQAVAAISGERTCRFNEYKGDFGDGFCSECHAYMFKHDSYCPNCGARVTKSDQYL